MKRVSSFACSFLLVLAIAATTFAPITNAQSLPDATPVIDPTPTPAASPSTIWLSEQSGYASTTLTIGGADFQPFETIQIILDGGSVILDQVSADATGAFSREITIPADATSGPHSIVASSTSGLTASTSFEVLPNPAASVALSSSTGSVGSSVTIGGSFFEPFETITVSFGGIELPSSAIVASSDGGFSTTLTVPIWAELEAYSIEVTGDLGNTAYANFAVSGFGTVSFALGTTAGPAGSAVSFTGNGFRPNESVTIRWGTATGPALATVTSDKEGKIEGSITIPSTADKSTFTVYAVGTSGQTGLIAFTVTEWAAASVSISAGSGRAGSVVTINGTG